MGLSFFSLNLKPEKEVFMAWKKSDLLQAIQNTQIRIAIDRLLSLAGVTSTTKEGDGITSDVTGDLTGNVTGDVTGDVTGSIDSRGTAISSGGAGAVSTAFAPRTYRYTNNDVIITEIEVDLTGLACKGDAADDVIGLAAGGAAYIGQHTEALDGIVYKAELITLEAPGEGTATITADINVTMNTSALLEYDGAASNSYLFNTGGLAKGNTIENLVPALTDTDYIYLTEGDTAGSTGEYDAGQIVIRLYGKAALS